MPINVHLIITLVASALGLFGGFYAGQSVAGAAEQSGTLQILFLFGGALIGCLIPYLVFGRLVPARCPECAGRSFPGGRRPIRYHCRHCGHVYRTRVFLGKHRRFGGRK